MKKLVVICAGALLLSSCKTPFSSEEEEVVVADPAVEVAEVTEVTPSEAAPVAAEPSPATTEEPIAVVMRSVSIQLPDGYSATEISPAALAQSGVVVAGSVESSSTVRVVASHSCKESIVLEQVVSEDLSLAPNAGADKLFNVSFVVPENATLSLANPARLGCGTHELTARTAGGVDLVQGFTVQGSDLLVTIAEWETGFAVGQPTHRTDLFGSHDTAERTLSLSHSGDSLECSRDGGVTFSTCGASFEYTVAEYQGAAELQFRIRKTGHPDAIHFYVPATDDPGLTFVECTEHITQAEALSAFRQRLGGANDNAVICIDPEITFVDDLDAVMMVFGSNIRILGTENNPAVFTVNQSFISRESLARSLTLAHLRITMNAYGGPIAIGYYGENPGSVDVIKGVTLVSKSYGILAMDGTNLLIEDSTITVSEDWGYSAVEIASTGSVPPNVTLRRVDVRAESGLGLSIYDADVTVEDSVIHADSDWYDAVRVRTWNLTSATLDVSNSTIVTGAYGIYGSVAKVGDRVTVELDGNTFKHSSKGFDSLALRLNNGPNAANPGSITLNSTLNNNVFCHTSHAVGFSSVEPYGAVPRVGSTYDSTRSPQTDEDIGTCSP